jgi:hypothetical protein
MVVYASSFGDSAKELAEAVEHGAPIHGIGWLRSFVPQKDEFEALLDDDQPPPTAGVCPPSPAISFK